MLERADCPGAHSTVPGPPSCLPGDKEPRTQANKVPQVKTKTKTSLQISSPAAVFLPGWAGLLRQGCLRWVTLLKQLGPGKYWAFGPSPHPCPTPLAY